MKAWNSAVNFFSQTETGTALALCRIFAGLLVVLLLIQPLFEGVVPSIWLNTRDGGIFPITKWPYLIRLFGGYSADLVYTVIGVGIFSGVAVAAGVWHRFFAFVGLQCILTITALNPYTPNGGDSLISNMLWLLIFADASRTLSITTRLRKRSWFDSSKVPSWPRYLMIAQLCILYLSAGSQKLSTHWIPFGDGQALWYIFQMPAYARADFLSMAWISPVLQFSTYLSWLFENIGPWLLLLTLRAERRQNPDDLRWLSRKLLKIRFRVLFICLGIAIHLGVFATMNVGVFSWAALMYYPCIMPKKWFHRFENERPVSTSE
jgi:hypothetical protein